MTAFVEQGLATSPEVVEKPKLEYPHIYDEEGFSIDIVPSTKFYQSYNHEGEPLIYSGTHWECEYWTRALLKAAQDGGWSTEPLLQYEGTVGGKL
jgi:hypothetical protein